MDWRNIHTAEDLERMRVALSETHPNIALWLRPADQGHIRYSPASEREVIRKAALIAGVKICCERCWERQHTMLDPCTDYQYPPIEDCGK